MALSITHKNITDEQTRMDADYKDCVQLKELAVQVSYPDRGDVMDWYATFDDNARKKLGRGRKIYDPTAIQARSIWQNGIMGHYMPKEINWFAEQMAGRKFRDSKNVTKWLQETDEHLRFTLHASNYYEQKLVNIGDAGVIGDSFMYIEEDDETGKQMMLTPHPREFRIRRDFWGRVVAIHHRFSKTLAQIKDEFGEGSLSESQKETIKTKPDQATEIIHAVYKNKDFDPTQSGVKNMKWQHYYDNVTYKKIVMETGSTTLNPIPWSLNRPSHEPYGRGIVSQMFLEILTANLMGKDTLIASQLAVRPAWLLPASLKHKIRTGAGGKTFIGHREMQGLKMGDLIAKLSDSSGYPFGENNHEKWQAMVNERFGVSLFLALNMAGSQGYKNIEHIRSAQAERVVLMAPFLGTLGTTTDVELDRVYEIEREAKRAPEVPQEILDEQGSTRIDIQYIGPLAQLLKQYYETGSLLNTIGNIQAVLSIDESAGVVVEGDELMRKILKSGNAPEDIILSREEVIEIKAIAAQQQEQLAQAELAEKTAGMIPKLGGKIDKDSILGAMATA